MHAVQSYRSPSTKSHAITCLVLMCGLGYNSSIWIDSNFNGHTKDAMHKMTNRRSFSFSMKTMKISCFDIRRFDESKRAQSIR